MTINLQENFENIAFLSVWNGGGGEEVKDGWGNPEKETPAVASARRRGGHLSNEGFAVRRGFVLADARDLAEGRRQGLTGRETVRNWTVGGSDTESISVPNELRG